MTLSTMLAPAVRSLHALQKRSQVYNATALAMTVVGRNSEQPLFRDAIEGDLIGTIDAADWLAAFPTATPKRFDKVAAGGVTYTVQAWHAAPPDGVPVWYRLLLRGGSL